jgi:cell wall-associated NlpC family hydrolase
LSLRGAAIALTIFLATVAVDSPALGDSRIGEKQAESRSVVAQIGRLGHQLDLASEAYNGATYRLEQTRVSMRLNEKELDVARRNLRVAEHRLGARLRDIYVSGAGDPTLEVLLGARSLSDVIDLLEVQNRISREDAQIIGAVTRFKADATRTHARLRQLQADEERLVARRAAERRAIADGLAEQHRLLTSISGEIARLRHEEAMRQAELAAEAAARLAQQRRQGQQALRAVAVGATAMSPDTVNGFPSAAVVPPSLVGSRVVAIAEQYLGRPYVWGAAGPFAFDCSGLVTYVFEQVGILLPHFAAAQWNYGTYVSREQLEPGDLVFFENLGHVGIYLGNDDYIQAPQPGDVVKITPLSEPWSAANYYGAKRITS